MSFGQTVLVVIAVIGAIGFGAWKLPAISNAVGDFLRGVLPSDDDGADDDEGGLDTVDRMLVGGMVVLGVSWIGLWLATA